LQCQLGDQSCHPAHCTRRKELLGGIPIEDHRAQARPQSLLHRRVYIPVM
jgi:hypothetical protein